MQEPTNILEWIDDATIRVSVPADFDSVQREAFTQSVRAWWFSHFAVNTVVADRARQAGLTFDELAEATRSDIENLVQSLRLFRRPLTVDELHMLADVLGTTASAILGAAEAGR